MERVISVGGGGIKSVEMGGLNQWGWGVKSAGGGGVESMAGGGGGLAESSNSLLGTNCFN